MFSWNKYYSIKKQYETKFKIVPKQSGIYLWRRHQVINGTDYTFWYVGQAKNLFNRRFDYYQVQTRLSPPKRHFEASLLKHKDWSFTIIELCKENELNEREQFWINYYMGQPYHITRNDLLCSKDIVQSNYKRVESKVNKELNNISTLLKRLNVERSTSKVSISIKKNKDGTNNKVSETAFKNLMLLFR